jgi:hypothetical protein
MVFSLRLCFICMMLGFWQFLSSSSWRYPYIYFFLFLGVGWDWVHWVRRPLTGLLHQARTIDDECGAVGGMRIGRGNQSTWRKPAPVPLRSPQILHHLTWARTWAAAVGSRRLTAWGMAWPPMYTMFSVFSFHSSLFPQTLSYKPRPSVMDLIYVFYLHTGLPSLSS